MAAAEAASTPAAEAASTPSADAEAASTTKTTAPTTTAASGSYFISNFELNVDWMKVAQSQLGLEYICRTCSADSDLKLKVGEEPKMIHHGGRSELAIVPVDAQRCYSIGGAREHHPLFPSQPHSSCVIIYQLCVIDQARHARTT